MAEQNTARVDLRHHTLADDVELIEESGPNGAHGFIALAEPPPVGSVVHLHPGGRALAVAQVVETASPERGTGIYVREASAEDLERHGRIGTERMGPSNLDPSAGGDGSDDVLPADAGPAVIGDVTTAQPSGAEPAPEPTAATPEPMVAVPQPAPVITEPEPEPEAAAQPEPEPEAEPEPPADTAKGRGGGKRRKGRRRS